MDRPIHHDAERRRFTTDVGGQDAYLVYRDLGGGRVDYVSTFVPPAARGRGIGARLARHALDWAAERGWKVVPSCWFVAKVMERVPGYERLRA
jgi:predicted GNAT family acetyltransferase